MMALAQTETTSAEFNYHLLRNALQRFGRNLAQLSSDEFAQVSRLAQQSFELESRVLGSPEAAAMVVSSQQMDQSLAAVAARYQSPQEFAEDLQNNGLDEEGLRHALQRELLFDGVMQRVAAQAAEVKEIDLRLFYEMHLQRFVSPELRLASHILITINNDYPENCREQAQARIQQVSERLAGRPQRFAEMAKRYSECPTAMEGGKLGEVGRGKLFPSLDAALFGLQEGEVSLPVESELGFHLLLCDKIKPSRTAPFTKVAGRIRELLVEQRRHHCQKAWLAGLSVRG